MMTPFSDSTTIASASDRTRIANQPSLFRAHGDRRRRPKGDTLVMALIAAIERRGGGWISAAVLARDLDVGDRAIRGAASASRGQVIGGQYGYTLTRHASIEEVNHVVGFLLGQSTAMRRRAMEIERVRHGKQVSA